MRYTISIPYDERHDGDLPARIQQLADDDPDARGKIGDYLRKIILASAGLNQPAPHRGADNPQEKRHGKKVSTKPSR
jgi:hypothetical protein